MMDNETHRLMKIVERGADTIISTGNAVGLNVERINGAVETLLNDPDIKPLDGPDPVVSSIYIWTRTPYWLGRLNKL